MLVEAVVPMAADTAVPACIDGRRACPPEDCGGPPGYWALIDSTDPRHEDMLEWYGPDFEPERFEIHARTGCRYGSHF